MKRLKPGDWIHAETPGGGIVQGRVSRLALDSPVPHVVLPDGTKVPLSWIQQRLGPMSRDGDGTIRQNPVKGYLTGERVRALMRAGHWTIAGLAAAMNVTQQRVKQARTRGVIEGPEYERDWIEALTRKTNPTKGRTMATAKKKPTAKQLAARKLFAARARAGTLGKTRKANPLTRVKVKSPSMATKKAPTKRLTARRKATAKAPRGYYANPAGHRAPAGYAVHKATTSNTAGALLAVFPNKPAAVQYGKAYADMKQCAVVIVGKAR
jgi:hypothetical protein